jgi:plasmid maintenance system antidote protein VapI
VSSATRGRIVANGAEIWLRMQIEHDLWRAMREVDVSGIETLEIAA